MRYIFPRSVVCGLAITMMIGAILLPHGAKAGCARALEGVGKAIVLPSPFRDTDRVALSNSIYEALRGPDGATSWPQGALKTAPACVLASFQAEDHTFVLSGGDGVLPPRWAQAATTDVVYYLAEGRQETAAPPAGAPKRRPYFLAALSGRRRFVIQAYDGAPADSTLQADIAASFDPKFSPLADYDSESGAVTVYRDTPSRIGAQLFGPIPTAEHPASIYLPDGHYFVTDDKLDARMRGSGLPCPSDLGMVKLQRMIVADGQDETLDLACQYDGDDGWLTVFVTHGGSAPLKDKFRTNVKDAWTDFPGARTTAKVSGRTGEFAFGETWRGEDTTEGGLWMADRDGYRIEVRGTWKSGTDRPIKLAVSILHDLAFGPNPFDKP